MSVIQNISYEQLHKDRNLDFFIEELEEILRNQKETIGFYAGKEFLSVVIAHIQVQASELNVILEGAKKYRESLNL